MAKADLTAARLRECLSYDSETGLFTRILAVQGPNGNVGRVCGSPDRHGYISIVVDGRRYTAGRLAWFYTHSAWPVGHIDHMDGDRKNNRASNLRDVPRLLNQHNRRKAQRNSTTGLMGVSPCLDAFRATIMVDGKTYNLGRFKMAQEAHEAYLIAKRAMHPGFLLRDAGSVHDHHML